MKTLSRSTSRFHPAMVLAVALIAALLFAIAIVVVFDGETRWFLLYYYVPVGIPFVAFLFDRFAEWNRVSRAAWLIDPPVLALALWRSVYPVPFVSGHALFLTFALLTTHSRLVQVTSALVLLEVIVVKIFLWQDPTLFGGMIVGLLAGRVFRWMLDRERIPFEAERN